MLDSPAAAGSSIAKRTRIEGDSIGAAVEVVAGDPPALAGDPLYQSLKMRLMGTLGRLRHAAQGVEESGLVLQRSNAAAANNDPIRSRRLPEQPPRRVAGRDQHRDADRGPGVSERHRHESSSHS
jgi:chorismate synthase